METKKNKGGRLTTAERLQRYNAYCTYRQMGKNQREAGKHSGVSEKTAGRFERTRIKQIKTTTDLIGLLQRKANAPDICPKDLVLLSKEIDRLTDKLQKTRSLLR